MNRSFLVAATACLVFSLLFTGCERKVTAQQSAADNGGAVPGAVVPDLDSNNFKVDHPDQFPLAAAGQHVATPELNVTGVVNPDVSRQVPVPSLATGRIVEIDARLGDVVKKGQLLFKVRSSDIAGAFSNYRQAVKNEELTRIQLERATILFEHGAVPKSAQEVAQNAEDDNLVVLENSQGAARTAWGRPEPSHRYRRSFCSGGGNHYGPGNHQPVGRPGADCAESLHNFRSVSGLDSLRCVGEQYVAGSHRRVCRHPSGGLSEPRS